MAAPAGYDPGQSLLAGGSGHLEAMRGGGMVGGDGDFKVTDEIIQFINKQILEIFKTPPFNPDKIIKDVESDMSGGGDFTSFPTIRDEWSVRKQHLLAALNAMNDAKSGSSINNLVGAINQVIRDGYFVKSGGVYAIESRFLDGRISYRFADILRLIRTIANYLEGLTYNIKFSDTTNATIKNVPVTYMPAEAETGGAGAGAAAPVPAPATAASGVTTAASGSAATPAPTSPSAPAATTDASSATSSTSVASGSVAASAAGGISDDAATVPPSRAPADFITSITDEDARTAVRQVLEFQPGDTPDKKVFSLLASLLSTKPEPMGAGGEIVVAMRIPPRTGAGAPAGGAASSASATGDLSKPGSTKNSPAAKAAAAARARAVSATSAAGAGATPPTATPKKGGAHPSRKTRRRHKTLRKAKGPATRRSKA